MFGMSLAGSAASFLLLLRAPEAAAGQLPATDARQAAVQQEQESRLLLQLVAVNALNGVGIGLAGPLIACGFAVRFNVGAGQIGPVMALGFLLAARASLFAGWLTARLGIVRAVTGMRLAGLVMLLLLPFMPTFGLAAALCVLRTALNQGAAGARQALGINLVRPHRRGLLALPVLIATAFQGGCLYFYQKLFRRHDSLPQGRTPGGAPGE